HRQIRFKADYKFAGEDGNVCLKYDAFGQVDPSAPNVVYTQGGQSVVGFEPGFIEPFFHEVAGNGSSGANYRALEQNKGKVDHFGLDIGYKFKGAGLRADLNYHNYNFKRSSDLNVTTQTSAVYQNYIDFKYNTLALKLAYPFNERFCLNAGFEQATMKGHHALMGQYFEGIGGYTATPTAANAKADNMNLVQSVPYLGFDYKLSKSTTWGLNLNFISLNDKSDGAVGSYRNPSSSSTTDPFKYSGTQLFTEVKVSF
ncbi:MAG: hypothetical protein M1269_10750, partial [Chloroflexi bacterium]|nr:hypothetical protein [Chloroflexota bacterium]